MQRRIIKQAFVDSQNLRASDFETMHTSALKNVLGVFGFGQRVECEIGTLGYDPGFDLANFNVSDVLDVNLPECAASQDTVGSFETHVEEAFPAFLGLFMPIGFAKMPVEEDGRTVHCFDSMFAAQPPVNQRSVKTQNIFGDDDASENFLHTLNAGLGPDKEHADYTAPMKAHLHQTKSGSLDRTTIPLHNLFESGFECEKMDGHHAVTPSVKALKHLFDVLVSFLAWRGFSCLVTFLSLSVLCVSLQGNLKDTTRAGLTHEKLCGVDPPRVDEAAYKALMWKRILNRVEVLHNGLRKKEDWCRLCCVVLRSGTHTETVRVEDLDGTQEDQTQEVRVSDVDYWGPNSAFWPKSFADLCHKLRIMLQKVTKIRAAIVDGQHRIISTTVYLSMAQVGARTMRMTPPKSTHCELDGTHFPVPLPKLDIPTRTSPVTFFFNKEPLTRQMIAELKGVSKKTEMEGSRKMKNTVTDR